MDYIVPFTWLSAASAFSKSPSLKLLKAPPPGVLVPLMTDPERERTFMTNGLSTMDHKNRSPSNFQRYKRTKDRNLLHRLRTLANYDHGSR